jgi:hypothetical protein
MEMNDNDKDKCESTDKTRYGLSAGGDFVCCENQVCVAFEKCKRTRKALMLFEIGGLILGTCLLGVCCGVGVYFYRKRAKEKGKTVVVKPIVRASRTRRASEAIRTMSERMSGKASLESTVTETSPEKPEPARDVDGIAP